MNHIADKINQLMSLREPQVNALKMLDRFLGSVDLHSELNAIESEAKSILQDKDFQFDTDFPSLCNSIATGVGKTRLMGASIYYLWKTKGFKNYFILAPNNTIYSKLKKDLTLGTSKYMFKGLPDLTDINFYHGENYLNYASQPFISNDGNIEDSLAVGEGINIYLFNISKIFNRKDVNFKFHEFQETLGMSFSDFLRTKSDLVVLMDESHRYRAPASLKAIHHLNPKLGLEYTATPKVDQKNIIYSFGLPDAMGRYLKTPTVLTRTNFDPEKYTENELEKIKLIDGLNRHQRKKIKIDSYCELNGYPRVKPIVLISTKDTNHASMIKEFIESNDFFEGTYRKKVIEIHSGLKGAESDENVQKLLDIENYLNPIEIVIHVNMLKEGWDVNNLYTIIPLRASVSDILTEQTIGRGLRLPFGELTNDLDLDELEIIFHEKYNNIIDAAKKSSLFKIKEVDNEEIEKEVEKKIVSPCSKETATIIKNFMSIKSSSETTDLKSFIPSIEKELLSYLQNGKVNTEYELMDTSNLRVVKDESDVKKLILEIREVATKTIEVPYIIEEVKSKSEIMVFEPKNNYEYRLTPQKLKSENLKNNTVRNVETAEFLEVKNPLGELVIGIIKSVNELSTDDIGIVKAISSSYLKNLGVEADILGKLVAQYRSTIINDLANQIREKIRLSSDVSYSLGRRFIFFDEYNKVIEKDKGIKNFRETVEKSKIKDYLYSDYKKSYYSLNCFDSTPEKDFSIILEDDNYVEKWIRLVLNNLPISYSGKKYNPDFIVETEDKKYLIEIKAHNNLNSPEVLEKAETARNWCDIANNYSLKKWEYVLLSDTDINKADDFLFTISHAVQ